MPRNLFLRLAALAAAASLSSCGGGTWSRPSGLAQREAELPAVEAEEVMLDSLPLEERLAGSVRARNHTTLVRAPIDGTVGARDAEIGQQATTGGSAPFVTVDLLSGESEEVPVVPNSALYRHPRDGREGVFVARLSEALANPEIEPASGPQAVAAGGAACTG